MTPSLPLHSDIALPDRAARARMRGAGCLALLLLAPVAHAQRLPAADDALRDDAESVYLSPLIVTATAPDPYTEPAARSTIGRDAIDLFGGQNLDDALRSTAGTFSRDNPQNPGVAVNLRGLEGSGRVNMMIDGVRQGFRFTGHEAQGFTYVDTALLAGVDISRGAVAGAGGAGALAGSANFRTLAADDVLRAGDGAGGFVSASIGDNGSGFAPVAAAAVREGAWSAIGAFSQRSPDAYHNGDGERVLGTGQDLRSGLAKLEYAGDVHRFGFGGMVYENDFLANSYDQNIDSRQYSANYAWTPGHDFVDMRVNAYRTDVRMKYRASPTIEGGGGARGRVVEDTGTGFDAANTMRFGAHVTSTIGIEYFHDDIDTINSASVPDRGVNPSGESSIASLFSETSFRYGITDLVLGLRYDRYTLEGSGSVAAGNPLGMPAGPYVLDRSDGAFNPSLTFAVQPLDWLQPYIRWSRTFRPPTVQETLMGGDHPAEGGPPQMFYPNPFLEPEVSKGWELGVNLGSDRLFTADDRVRAKVTVFRNEVDDYVTAMFGSGTWFGNNEGTSLLRGVEVEGGYDAGFVFANLAYTHVDSDLPSQVNGLGAQSYMPDEVSSLTLGTRLLARRLTLGARWSDVSRSYIGEVNSASGDPWEPGYELVDVFANYAFASGVELRANVSNAADEAFTPALSTPAGGNSGHTGRGRTWSFTAKVPF